jgi:WD40 repeat protein
MIWAMYCINMTICFNFLFFENACVRRSGEQVNTFNPIIGINRLIKVRLQGKQPYFAKKNTAKQDAGKFKKKKENVLKLTVTSMTWIERKRQMVFATSNSKLSFWNSRLVHLIDFIDTVAPQLGMLFSSSADLLLTWAGDKVNYDYSAWDCNSRTLRYQFNMHTSIILTTVEMPSLGAIVSASMDRSLCMWPISKMMQKRESSFDDKKLAGHTYAIRSVCFAPQNDLIIGAGFDFDIYCWDPTTASLQMKLVGHRLSIVCVNTVNNPFERAASVDESGVVKIWNIDRAQGLRGTLLQSLMLHGAVPNHVFSSIAAFDNGKVVTPLFFNNFT